MITIGIGQIANSTNVAENFESIKSLLSRFKDEDVNLVLFPECSLSGFTARMKECTRSALQPFLDDIQQWVKGMKLMWFYLLH